MGIVHRNKIHCPLVVAATYSGFLIWHGGYSGAVPTLIAAPGNFLEEQMGVVPVSETIFAGYNFLIILALAVVVPIANILMRPKNPEERRGIPAAVHALEEETGIEPDAELAEMNPDAASAPAGKPVTKTPADWLDTSRFVTFILGRFGALYLASYFFGNGPITFNSVILTYFVLGLLLRPKHVVPSGGGQRVVQGPIMIPAAQESGADIARVAMGVAWGEAWTNMIQPFRTLPMLAIAGLGIRDIMGYTATILLVSGVVIDGLLLIL